MWALETVLKLLEAITTKFLMHALTLLVINWLQPVEMAQQESIMYSLVLALRSYMVMRVKSLKSVSIHRVLRYLPLVVIKLVSSGLQKQEKSSKL